MIVILTSIIIGFSLFSCTNNVKDYQHEAVQYFKDKHENTTILMTTKGKYLNSNNISYLIIYSDPKYDYSESKSTFSISIVGINTKNEMNEFEIEFLSSIYPEKYKKIINDSLSSIPGWNGTLFISDFNNNGIDEIGIFELTGMSFGFKVFELKNSRIVNILEYPSDSIISRIEYKVEERKFLINDEANNKTDYRWNKKYRKYK